ncbi:hypothetical protein N9Q86_02485 [Porticoccaceae bacterium]|nr:hypothetical protein [Porticoccaceae bacterium]MDC0002918.1 hypothetical protein [Porticoccaceae bacterium]
MNKWAVIITSTLVVGSILVGLYIAGSPSEQRLIRLDNKRVSALGGFANSVYYYRQRTGRMPENLEDLVDGQMLSSLPLDPVTAEPYTLQVTENGGYRLCAEFSRPSVKQRENNFWDHPAGFHCFELSATVDKNGQMVQPIMPSRNLVR